MSTTEVEHQHCAPSLSLHGCVGLGLVPASLLWSGMIKRRARPHRRRRPGGRRRRVRGCSRATHPAPLPSVALGVIAVVYTAVVGFLSVPAGPSAANGNRPAAAAGFAMAILLLRLTRSGTTCLTAVATCAALPAATAGICVVWTMPAEAAGAALATLSLAVLGLAARMSIAAAGLTPVFPTAR